jgi:hypothetical protein
MRSASVLIETVHVIQDQCLCLANQRTAQRLTQRFDRLFAPLGLTKGQFLDARRIERTVATAARRARGSSWYAFDHDDCGDQASRETELLALQADEADARVRRPALTEVGRAIVAKAVPLWREEHAKLVGQDAVALARTLGQLR